MSPQDHRHAAGRAAADSAICAGAASRLAWCGGALLLLWLCVYWALT